MLIRGRSSGFSYQRTSSAASSARSGKSSDETSLVTTASCVRVTSPFDVSHHSMVHLWFTGTLASTIRAPVTGGIGFFSTKLVKVCWSSEPIGLQYDPQSNQPCAVLEKPPNPGQPGGPKIGRAKLRGRPGNVRTETR